MKSDFASADGVRGGFTQDAGSSDSSFLSRACLSVISLLGVQFLRLLNLTYRWTWLGFEGEDRYWAEGSPCICAFWHSRQLFAPWFYRRAFRPGKQRKMFVLISLHTDGRLIAGAVRNLGIDSVAGSSSRRGREAMRELVKVVKEGSHASITPDGPRGPLQKLKPGVVRLAQMTGAPIRTVAYSAEQMWTLRTWDRFIVPKPFSRVVGIFGEPIYIPAELSEEEFDEYCLLIEERLNEATKAADSFFEHKKSRERKKEGE